MTIRFDDKGKFFTDIISKEATPVIIQTPANLIHGYIHVRPGERLSDEINNAELFMAVTDASVRNLEDKEIYMTEFIALNRQHIIWLLPLQELKHSPGESRGDES